MPEAKPVLTGHNKTNFFNRELVMYALGDIKFKKPIALKKMAYTMGFIFVWTFPVFKIFGLIMNPFFMIFAIAPPFLAAHYATKPVFGGKNLIDFTRTMIIYAREPKGWADLRPDDHLGKIVYFVESEIWIGRRREIARLQELKAERKAEKKTAKRPSATAKAA